MAFSVIDRVLDTSTTTGTGNFTCAGAVTGYQAFNSVMSGGETFYYLIEAVDGSGVPTGDWEIGLGATVSNSPFVFSRLPIYSSNSGSAVSFAAGTKRVHLTAPGIQIGTLSSVAKLSANLTAQNYTTATAIPFNSTQYDLGPLTAFHSGVTNNTRQTLPPEYGDAYVRLFGSVELGSITSADLVTLEIKWSGSGSAAKGTFSAPTTTPCFQIVSPIILASAADYFELFMTIGTDTSVDIIANNHTRFQIEVVQ